MNVKVRVKIETVRMITVDVSDVALARVVVESMSDEQIEACPITNYCREVTIPPVGWEGA